MGGRHGYSYQAIWKERPGHQPGGPGRRGSAAHLWAKPGGQSGDRRGSRPGHNLLRHRAGLFRQPELLRLILAQPCSSSSLNISDQQIGRKKL